MRYSPWQSSYFECAGGLDQVTPPLKIPPGFARSALNYEIGVNGGYSRITGYERYDGHSRPSDALYHSLSVSIMGGYLIGDTITGATSGATGVIIAATSGTFFITKLTGTFQAEVINIGGSPIATSSGASVAGGAETLALNATYLNLAADKYRADISAVPGSGSVLGVWMYGGDVYAFRNNAGGTAAVLHKNSGSGWTAVTLYNEISFTAGGTATPADGQTLTQGAVTAVIKRVVTQSGAWSGTAAGRFIIVNPTGGNFAAGAATVSVSGATVTLSAVQTAISFLPSGKFEFVNHNFGGSVTTKRMYGVDGVNRAFEFDGTVLVPLSTTMTTDTPKHVIAHKNHLFLSFGSSAEHCSIGNPYQFTALTGAAEIAMGDTITGFVSLPGDENSSALGIYTKNRTGVLYGSSSADWSRVFYSQEAGAIEWSIKALSQVIALDSMGLTTLGTTSNFGNFKDAVISRHIEPTVSSFRTTTTASCIVRNKNQYRIFSSSGDAIYVTFSGGKLAGMMPVSLDHPISCICSEESSSGSEEIYFGSTDGYVYQMEKGTSFDGNEIAHNIQLAYNHFGSPRLLKQFRKAAIEVTGNSYCDFSFGYSLGYGSSEIPQPTSETVTTNLSVPTWDSFTWNDFFWDGQTLSPEEIDLDGIAENISLIFSGSSDEYGAFTINGAVMSYSPRRGLR